MTPIGQKRRVICDWVVFDITDVALHARRESGLGLKLLDGVNETGLSPVRLSHAFHIREVNCKYPIKCSKSQIPTSIDFV